MKALVAKISTISVIMFVCLCGALEVKADKSDEWFLLEARLSKRTMRSAKPQQVVSPVRVDLIGGEISLAFYQSLGQVSIRVYDESMRPVYVDYSNNPKFEYVSVDGWKGGMYVVEIVTDKASYSETVFVE